MADEKKFVITDPSRIGLGRDFRFEAGHILPGYDGKCATPHGHSYHGRVLVSAPRACADARGIVVDFDILKAAIQDCIVGPYDHRTLDCTAESLVQQIASALQAWFRENAGKDMVIAHHHRICPASVEVDRVVLYETANCYVEWKRDGYAP